MVICRERELRRPKKHWPFHDFFIVSLNVSTTSFILEGIHLILRYRKYYEPFLYVSAKVHKRMPFSPWLCTYVISAEINRLCSKSCRVQRMAKMYIFHQKLV